ncbi:MAG: hypothetical protein ACM3X6_14145 [Patescibacteria group bacterium]
MRAANEAPVAKACSDCLRVCKQDAAVVVVFCPRRRTAALSRPAAPAP